ncbi:amylo-alpha-1,6-glucosidase [Marivirga sp. S37H4]|uniref:Amylo-alpha-1,6-glucosidase n=1 Tax=Marivirga aurantiaca TaxID=2802615 RepID=A0A935C5M8_9BACT|nr:amylo-alpha-1,6-glucosidase [Marivirga aurantiaca]MBK6263904.1 amylo-alpha-1,6-glucosidase [Marivirga aurantiaca]
MNIIEIGNQHYILATSSFADDRTAVLKHGESFGVFDQLGDIHQIGQKSQGLYHEGTRFLSKLAFTMENKRPLLLSSNTSENNEMHAVDLTNPDFSDKSGEMVLRGMIHVLRNKFLLEEVAYEKISFLNFANFSLDFNVELQFEADYDDIFEVRGSYRDKKGECTKPKSKANEILMGYTGLDKISRTTRITFDPPPQHVLGNIIQHNIKLAPKETFDLYVSIAFEVNHKKPQVLSYKHAVKERNNYNASVKKDSAEIFTSNEQFNDWISRSKADMITMVTQTEHGAYPYAGIPWYSTPFGRDGIITAYESLWVEPLIAKGVLKYLAATQATKNDDFTDAEPGKILHEKRGGEMAELGEIPFKQYYGTIDATPLFVCLAGAYFERTGDEETIREIWPNIENAISWIDKYGDIDGDGFVEYATKSSKGLINQGWKDSFDAVFHENGKMAKGPIALCEVQAYVYDAKIQAATMAREFGFSDKASKWTREAEELKEKFNRTFWSESKNTYVLALDGKKKACNVVTSNAGHCLFSGIATKEKAKKVAKSIISESMFSGWGVRTLATEEACYNPMSYHNGSIWPHDNAMIAYGLSRYGLQREVSILLTGMFDTSIHEADQRLPELFCGFKRRKGHGPTAYPVACSPQAWAVGSVYLLLQAALGLNIDARKCEITLHKPVLPPYLNEITIRNLRVDADNIVVLQIRKVNGNLHATLLNGAPKVKVKILNEMPKDKNVEPHQFINIHS